MRSMSTTAFILIISCAATAVIAASTKISDKFSSSSFGSIWTNYSYGGTALLPSGGVLKVNGGDFVQGAIAIQGYQLKTNPQTSASWKASVAVKQVIASTSFGTDADASTFVGLQYDDFSEDGFLDLNNGYQLNAVINSDGVYVGWVELQDGDYIDSDGLNVTSSKKLSGNIVATYTGKNDRLVVQVGKFKQIFNGFWNNNAYYGNPKPYIGTYSWEVLGTICTLDNFSLTGNAIIPAE